MNPFAHRPCPCCAQPLPVDCSHVDTVAVCPACDATIELRACPKTGRGMVLVEIGLKDISDVDRRIRQAVRNTVSRLP